MFQFFPPHDTGIAGKSDEGGKHARRTIVRSIDVWNAIDRLAIERIAIRHGDRDRDNARLTSLVPITHEAISHGISPDRIDRPALEIQGRRNCARLRCESRGEIADEIAEYNSGLIVRVTIEECHEHSNGSSSWTALIGSVEDIAIEEELWSR